MLKFLTHKLRTHSINEDNDYAAAEQADEERDSGTESDEEIDHPDLPSVMSERMCSVSPADTGCSMESPGPDQHDPHSSEEELEVINSNKTERADTRPLRATSVSLPEKRKWSQVGDSYARHHKYTPENEENMSHYSNLSPSSPCSPYHKCYGEDGIHIEHSGSSDEEVHHLLTSMAPVQFRTSPPLEALKPGRRMPQTKGPSMSPPPPKLVHYDVSPRKRSRHTRHIQRPSLDFEKMQHLKARSVRTWRNSGDHSGELSVYCW